MAGRDPSLVAVPTIIQHYVAAGTAITETVLCGQPLFRFGRFRSADSTRKRCPTCLRELDLTPVRHQRFESVYEQVA